MADNKQIAADVVEAVGGRDNIMFATHCMTRLRLNLKDQSKVDDEKVKAVNGVLGVKKVGDQYQVVIGQNVEKVYPEVIAITGLEAQDAVDENCDDVPDSAKDEKEKLTFKKVCSNILDYVSGSMVPILPAIMTAGLMKTIQVILGPTILGLITTDSSFYTFLQIVYNAGMYFIPFYLAFSAAKKLNTSVIVAEFLAALLLEPTFVGLVSSGSALDFLGLPIGMVNYKQSVVPILLSVWVMSYVYRFFNKHIPDVLSTMFVPFCTVAVMAPVTYVVLAPLGSYLGDLIAGGLMALASAGGVVTVLAYTLLTAFQPFLVMTGMHQALVTFGLSSVAETGMDPYILVCNLLSNFAVWAACLGVALRFKNPNDKSNALGAFVSGILGGVTEPGLFGVILEHRRLFGVIIASNAVCGCLAGILQVYLYNLGASSILSLLCFISADRPSNVINAAICGGVGFALSLVLSYLFGLTKEEIEGKQAQ